MVGLKAPKSILVVDDEEDIREIFSEALADHFGTKVKLLTAGTGSEALQKIQNQKFDLVITDIKMPKMDGKDLILSLKGIHEDFQPDFILIISGNISKEKVQPKKGKISSIPKPVDVGKLIDFVSDALFPSKKKGEVFDVEFVNPFIESTLTVLEGMAGVKAEKELMFIREDSHSMGDISALIGMESETYIASFSITFEEKSYLQIMSNMMGEEYTVIDEECRDGVAEICNQVYSGAKKILNGKGHTLGMALPSIIVGANHELFHPVKGAIVSTSFTTEFGTFYIEAAMSKK